MLMKTIPLWITFPHLKSSHAVYDTLSSLTHFPFQDKIFKWHTCSTLINSGLPFSAPHPKLTRDSQVQGWCSFSPGVSRTVKGNQMLVQYKTVYGLPHCQSSSSMLQTGPRISSSLTGCCPSMFYALFNLPCLPLWGSLWAGHIL
jgi:hypothetical protein